MANTGYPIKLKNQALGSLQNRTREKIKTTMIVAKLQDHIDGKCEMSSTQIQAARILLDRTVPVLKSYDIQAVTPDLKDVSHLSPQFLMSIVAGMDEDKQAKLVTPIDE